ncbi:hypothetical protein BDV98DRAFT_96436 [Pterulicium gracile]|uniref:Uncharacterized protein n=1 Tax=Pterulicium gracile TaxID=1884261 RepID=A0A5C3QFF9_9AGAR|nr:hypothetical protein BDV98DRAFT_96436 [Pterula gracilis]
MLGRGTRRSTVLLQIPDLPPQSSSPPADECTAVIPRGEPCQLDERYSFLNDTLPCCIHWPGSSQSGLCILTLRREGRSNRSYVQSVSLHVHASSNFAVLYAMTGIQKCYYSVLSAQRTYMVVLPTPEMLSSTPAASSGSHRGLSATSHQVL